MVARHRPADRFRTIAESPQSGDVLREMVSRLKAAYGPQHWWPARTRCEVVVGAILTQNTAWTNVERAIRNLRRARVLSFTALRDLSEDRLAELIRPAGTYRVKARRLKAWVARLWADHNRSLDAMLAGPVDQVRRRLLAIHGIGPETADAILLYAGSRPTFVVDAYALRIFRRHRLIDPGAGYETVRRLCLDALDDDVPLCNEFHALLVELGKRHCRSRALCDGCPLAAMPHDAQR